MAYSHTNSKGKTYFLHANSKENKDGSTRTLYFFKKEVADGALDSVPDGYKVGETKTGLLVLKKDV